MWRHPLRANIPALFYSMMKTRRKITKIFSFTPPFVDRRCVSGAADGFPEQHGQLCGCQRHCSARDLRPDESSALQLFREKTQAVPIEPQNLDQVTAPTTENEDVTREWILLKCCLHHSTQACKSSTKICHPCGDPDPRSRRQPDHPSKHSIAVRSTTTSTFPATRRVPLASLISIDPTANGEDVQAARPDLLSEMPDNVTGRSLLDWRLPSRPSRYFLRQ